VRLQLWRRRKRALVVALVVVIALYGLDALIALPRIGYARHTLDHPVIHGTMELPRSLVLVNASCGAQCHARLLTGELEEVILVETDPLGRRTPKPPRRYRVGWTRPGACPPEREKAMPFEVRNLLRDGFCPLIEPAEIPSEGVFVVEESFTLVASEKAIPFTPTYLVDGPPGRLVTLQAVQVQQRTRAGIKVLAAQRHYEAPGLIGLPPLIGCWERPDNIVWILPAGDTGCGLWRWFTWGGDARGAARSRGSMPTYSPVPRGTSHRNGGRSFRRLSRAKRISDIGACNFYQRTRFRQRVAETSAMITIVIPMICSGASDSPSTATPRPAAATGSA
jgi:hypothetical protein